METLEIEKALTEVGALIENGQPLLPKNFSNEDLEILYTLGYHLYNSGDYAQAKLIFKQLVLSKPLEHRHWFGLGSVLQIEKTYSEALVSWSMASLLNGEDPLPHFHAAECLLSLNQKEEAFKAFDSAEVLIKNTGKQEELLGKIEYLKERWNHAS